jgi:enoyl-CoA hydratase/carnithine racemase
VSRRLDDLRVQISSRPTLRPVTSFETVLFSKDDGIARVSLNRPKVRNAINQRMQDELREVWRDVRYDSDVRCVVLTAEGESFCTGIDRGEAVSDSNLEDMADGNYPGYPTPWMYDDPGRDIGPKARDCWKPVIAAVQGMACGGAFYILGEVEFIIASDDATFFDPHVTYGMTAAFEPIQLLAKMPFQEIMRMSLLGADERMSAERAREIGLVTELVPREELRERAEWAARVIADAPPLAIQGTMRALWTALELSRHQGIELANLFTRIGTSAEAFRAGQQRFASGKRPQWRLR